jgi:transcriptional regulator with XRE-family HTH domain
MSYADVNKRFGQAIKAWRRKSGISQEELAGRAGLHRTYVADIERGARNPSLQSIHKLAMALRVSFSTLFEPFGEFPGNGRNSRTDEIKDIIGSARSFPDGKHSGAC